MQLNVLNDLAEAMKALDGKKVISGSLAGGIPGFRIVLCCFTHTTVWQCDFCVSVFRFVWFRHTNA